MEAKVFLLSCYYVIIETVLLTLKAAYRAGGEGGAVSKDEAVLLVLQVGGPGAGRGLLTQLTASHLAFRIIEKNAQEKLTWCL